MSYNIPPQYTGLSSGEVIASRDKYGYNEHDGEVRSTWLKLLLGILKEPMLILLIAISAIYLLTGDYGEAIFMLIAIIAVSGISFYQDTRSQKALDELRKINEPLSKVIRDSKVVEIPTREIVPGDLVITEEGKTINADGIILHSNDFSVNESTLTGESYSVYKSSEAGNNQVYSGTICSSGLAIYRVELTGKGTRIGQIGSSLAEITESRSPLQIQIQVFVRRMAVAGILVFLLVCGYSYYSGDGVMKALLSGLTLAMSVLPEEIPVAFTTFMALGAWKLSRQGIIVKQSTVVETLGSTTVICTDKTGTITENTMHLQKLYDYRSGRTGEKEELSQAEFSELIEYAMWGSEPSPFDPMETKLHSLYEDTHLVDLRPKFELFHEYPLEGKPPMMTHIFQNEKEQRVVAAKGAPEAIINVCSLSDEEKQRLREINSEFAGQGYRVLGVAKSTYSGNDFPAKQQDLPFEFLGFTVFEDPPKKGIRDVFRRIYAAGIKVKVITGDNPDTTRAVADQSGITNIGRPLTGAEIDASSEDELSDLVDKTSLFTRMYPNAKLKVVNALKRRGEVVAMLGDGVNDGPALKAAHIGVAMGSKGTEIAKAAASLIITNDNLEQLIAGIAAGRRIYANLKKAVQYIISIHIPIIITVSLPLLLGWIYPHIFTPVHVIFLELVMGPTCSIVYENEPIEKNTMVQPPRPVTSTFLNLRELSISIIQGIAITAGVLFVYQYCASAGGSEEKTRAMVFSTLIFSNVLLSFVNRSFFYSVFSSFRNHNPLLVGITVITLVLLFAILNIPFLAGFFKVTPLSISALGVCVLTALISVGWLEIYKLIKRSLVKAC